MKNKFQVIAILALLSYAQGGRNFDAVQVEVKKVQGSIYMLVGTQFVCRWEGSSVVSMLVTARDQRKIPECPAEHRDTCRAFQLWETPINQGCAQPYPQASWEIEGAALG